jgi:tyrosyl-tRNA synthetase
MEKGDGMSFAEFSYPLLQGWDWWHMYSNHDVQLQVGGSDQYGNIIAGMDAIKHISQISPQALEGKGLLDDNGKLKNEVMPMGITVPLLTTASGEKFGKSAGNAIWLDANLTSPFDLYGFLLRSSDADVARYLSLFTFVPLSTIAKTMTAHTAEPGKRLAQHLLASEVLELVHGREVAELTRGQHQAMRNPSLSGQSQLQGERTMLPRSLVAGTPVTRILWHAGIAGTKSEAARLVKSGGVYVADSVSESASAASEAQVSESKFAPIKNQKPENLESFTRDGLLVLRTGKWKVRIVEVVDDETFEKNLGGGEAPPGWEEWKSTSAERA